MRHGISWLRVRFSPWLGYRRADVAWPGLRFRGDGWFNALSTVDRLSQDG